jgi:serine/threonine-protein kinase
MPDSKKSREVAEEALLDRLFERVLDAVEAGESVDVAAIVEGRDELRAEVEQFLDDARAAVGLPPVQTPQLHDYVVLGELGRGGMGTVYLARQTALADRRVALKFPPPAALQSRRWRERFLDEARTLATVRHPNVVGVYDVIDTPEHCAYAMEWVDGVSLGRMIAHPRETTAARRAPELASLPALLGDEAAGQGEPYTVFVCRIGIAIARALAAMHRAGLVHRDVKPSNVLLRRDGTPLLSDFGLAHASDESLTKTGQFVGTVAYASPEQLEGEPESLDARSDVYALGVTLYQALSLHLPFDAARGTSAAPRRPRGCCA